MHKETGKVVPYDQIPPSERHLYSAPFKVGDIIEVKGMKFEIKKFWRGRLLLKMCKS